MEEKEHNKTAKKYIGYLLVETDTGHRDIGQFFTGQNDIESVNNI